MNQATFRGVALLLVAVACVALGCIDYNSTTVNAPAGENSTVAVDVKQSQDATATREVTQPQAATQPEENKEENAKSKKFGKFGVGILGALLGCIGIIGCFFNAFLQSLVQSSADYAFKTLKDYFMKIWEKIVGSRKRQAQTNDTSTSIIPVSKTVYQYSEKKIFARVEEEVARQIGTDERLSVVFSESQTSGFTGSVLIDTFTVPFLVRWNANTTNNKRRHWRLETALAQDFFAHGGGAFFVVYFDQCDRDEKMDVYYAMLYPYDLNKKLCNNKRKYIHVQLKPFVSQNGFNIFRQFLADSSREKAYYSTIRQPIGIDQSSSEVSAQEILVSLPNDNGSLQKLTLDTFHNCDARFYVSRKDAPPLPISAETLNGAEIHLPISVDQKFSYPTGIVGKTAKTCSIRYGRSLTLVSRRRTPQAFKIQSGPFFEGPLAETIKEARFCLAMYESNFITIGNERYCAPSPKKKDFLPKLKEQLKTYERFAAVFRLLNINPNTNYSALTEEHKNNVRALAISLLEKKPIPFNVPPVWGYLYLPIGTEKVALVCEKSEGSPNLYILKDYFKTQTHMFACDVNSPGNVYQVSPYMMLNKENLISVANLDFTNLIPSFRALPADPHPLFQATNLLLEILKAYDECLTLRKEERANALLCAAKELSQWVLEKENNVVHKLNYFQVLKRECGQLPKEYAQETLAISEAPETPLLCRLASSVLLEEEARSEKIWSQLSPTEQEEFASFPISKFFPPSQEIPKNNTNFSLQAVQRIVQTNDSKISA